MRSDPASPNSHRDPSTAPEPLPRVTDATIDVLRVLLGASTPVWGLAIIRDAGRPPGSVYPILDRLERAGWIAGEWEHDEARSGPRRRYYRLTAGGVPAARAAVAHRTELARRARRRAASTATALA